MMHGKFGPLPSDRKSPEGLAALPHEIWQRKWLLVVVIPTLVLALYYWAIAADQYEAEAHFLVRSVQGSSQAPSGLSAALSLVGGGSSVGNSDVSSVSDFLSSHDAVDALRTRGDLVNIFSRPEADFFSRLTPSNPTPERLLNYYRGQVTVKLDPDTGIAAIKVKTFRPEDSYKLVNELLALGEGRVNVLNRRAYESTLALSRRQLADAEAGLSAAQGAMTAFRQGRRVIDPVATGQAQINVVSTLQANLAQARAQRNAMAGSISGDSPQARAMDARIAALQGQIASESARLAGGGDAIATNVGDYQGLMLRQQFASARYDEAAGALQRAREQAIRQQMFIVRVVEPNMPVKSLYPKRLRIIGTVFVCLMICYSLGWLIAAGVREHAA